MSADETIDTHVPARATGKDAGFALIGIGASTAAVLASSCCVVPLLLASLGAGSAVFALLTAMAPYRLVLMWIAGLAVAAAWLIHLWRPRTACGGDTTCSVPRRAVRTLVLLSVATLLLATAAVWAVIEPVLLEVMRG
jgi:mercuric ion transport protein